MSTNYPRGSEWRKWDLHVHTPVSHLANRYGGDWCGFAERVGEQGLAVIGATNYFCLEDGEIDQVRAALADAGLDAVIFPNVEFRIAHPNNDGEYINIHAIFAPEVRPETINQSLSRVSLINTVADGRAIYCSAQSIRESGVGFENALIDLDCLVKQLRSDFQMGRDFILAALPRGQGDFRPARGDGRAAALAIEIDKKCQLMLGGEGDVEFFLRYSRYVGAVPKPVFAHSDAHGVEQIGSRFTWVKADPTFAGLMQTVFEPEERLRIQPESPALDFPKPFFARIRTVGKIMVDGPPDYAETDLPLNSNLVTLIGGRGTGKSLLLDSLFLTFDQDESFPTSRLDDISPAKFSVDYQKAESEVTEYPFGGAHPLDYLHVRQGDIRRYVESPDQLSHEIKKLLRIGAEGGSSPFDFELANLIEKIAKRRAWFNQIDQNGDSVNSLEFNQRKVSESTALIETITTESNRELIGQYSSNAQAINDKRKIQAHIAQVLSLANSAKSELTLSVKQLNEMVEDVQRLPLVDFEPLEKAAASLNQSTDVEITELIQRNEEISRVFREQGIDQDVSGLLAKVEQYQKAIDTGKSAIESVQSQTEQLEREVVARNGYSEAIGSELSDGKNAIDDRFAVLKAGSNTWIEAQKELVTRLVSDIDVSGKVVFDVVRFYEGLNSCLNGRKFRSTNTESQAERIQQKLNVSSYEDYFLLISGEPIIDDDSGGKLTLDQFSAEPDYFVSAEYDIFEYLYLHRYRARYLHVNAVIEYKGKPPEKLSVGQRGTFYVSMKLATDPFGSPFIFDQPEDDLDNEFIMKELVPIFRDIKKYRQVIIVTHNANLVVNADAEQVIVAHNVDEILSYESGSLENTSDGEVKGIREHVCTILEGGKDAFEKRERKYGFKAL